MNRSENEDAWVGVQGTCPVACCPGCYGWKIPQYEIEKLGVAVSQVHEPWWLPWEEIGSFLLAFIIFMTERGLFTSQERHVLSLLVRYLSGEDLIRAVWRMYAPTVDGRGSGQWSWGGQSCGFPHYSRMVPQALELILMDPLQRGQLVESPAHARAECHEAPWGIVMRDPTRRVETLSEVELLRAFARYQFEFVRLPKFSIWK